MVAAKNALEGAESKPAEGVLGARATPPGGEICIVDLGRQERRRIKKLRRGEGKLTRKVKEVTAALKAEGVIDASAQIVVVLVQEKVTMSGLFDDDDDDDDDD